MSKKEKKSKKSEPMIPAMPFGQMMSEVAAKQAAAEEYFRKTGKCFVCKKNPASKGNVRCQECIDKTNKLVEQLRGPGFFAFSLGIDFPVREFIAEK